MNKTHPRFPLLGLLTLALPGTAATTPSTGFIDVGSSHIASLKSDGTVWTWGSNTNGQLGDGTTVNRNTPIQVSGLTSVVSVGAGYLHTVVAKTDGTIWAWGDNSIGQLGDGTTTARLAPVQATGVSDIVAVSAGNTHTLALKSDGTVCGLKTGQTLHFALVR